MLYSCADMATVGVKWFNGFFCVFLRLEVRTARCIVLSSRHYWIKPVRNSDGYGDGPNEAIPPLPPLNLTITTGRRLEGTSKPSIQDSRPRERECQVVGISMDL